MYTLLVSIVIVLACVAFFAILCVHHNWGEWWEEHEHMPKNFPFKHKGRILWYSRSCAVASFIFAKNDHGEWCILANKRGKGAPDFKGFWNCPCGYLDFSETCAQAAKRETYEETGIMIPLDKFQFAEVHDDPFTANKQNVTMRFFAKVEDRTVADLKPHTTSLGEKDEVVETKWIPVKEIGMYKWAFDHGSVILSMYTRFIKD